MHLSSRTDIEAPISFVFDTLTDFDGWERAALRRGAEVSRTDTLRTPGAGMGWAVGFRFRGKDRKVKIDLVELETESRLVFRGESRMFAGDVKIEPVSLAPNRTRLVVHLDVRPLTLGARLVMQSVKLAKGKVQSRFNKRLAQMAVEIEQRYAATRRR